MVIDLGADLGVNLIYPVLSLLKKHGGCRLLDATTYTYVEGRTGQMTTPHLLIALAPAVKSDSRFLLIPASSKNHPWTTSNSGDEAIVY